ncbi:MAG TPA: hypothetical protein VIG30_18625 [Ktedonobacterales bacterium]|jgi:amino acid transporter
MRGAGIGLVVIGIIIGLVAVANHFALHFLNGNHYDTYIGIVGAVVAVIGIIMLAMGGRSSSAA